MSESVRPSRQIASITSLERLVDRLRAGDEQARVELIERVQGRLRQLVHVRLNHSFERVRQLQQTDGVAQDAVIRLHQALADIQPDNARRFLALAAKKVREVLLDLCRQLDRDRLQRVGLPAGSSAPSPLDEVAVKMTGAGTKEVYDILDELIQQLDDRVQEVFDLRYLNGLTFPEIGDLLEIGEENAKKRWKSALIQLRRRLRDRGVDSCDIE